MATYNGNAVYLTLDGTEIHAYFREVQFSRSIDSIDATAGSSTAHRERLAGLEDTSGTIKIVWDDAQMATLIPLIAPGIHTLVYGPEGNGSGNPKHTQSILITESPFTVGVEKPLVEIEVPFEGAAAPSDDLWDGAVWA